MKKALYPIFAIVLFASCGNTDKSNSIEDDNKEKKETSNLVTEQNPVNVEDYYYLLPEVYFVCDAVEAKDSKEFRKKAITKKNIKSGYLVSNPQGFYNLEVALFKNRKKNIDVIAAFISCGPGCMCAALDFLVWDPHTKKWDNITESIFPNYGAIEAKAGPLEDIDFKLPEKGTTIIGINSITGEEAISIKWDGERFNL